MAAKREKKQQLNSPKGVFKYAHLNKPDFGTEAHPKADGEFSVTIALDKDDAATKVFIAKLEEQAAALEDQLQDEFDGQSPKVKASWKQRKITEPTFMPFYADELTEAGEPTGRLLFRFKTKAQFKGKDGEIVKKVVPLVDGMGEMIPAKKRPLVYAGTLGRAAFTLGLAFIPKDAQGYMSFYLNQVQIAKLVSSGGAGQSAFGADEDSDFSAEELEEYEGNSKDQDDGGNDDLDDELPF